MGSHTYVGVAPFKLEHVCISDSSDVSTAASPAVKQLMQEYLRQRDEVADATVQGPQGWELHDGSVDIDLGGRCFFGDGVLRKSGGDEQEFDVVLINEDPYAAGGGGDFAAVAFDRAILAQFAADFGVDPAQIRQNAAVMQTL